MTQEGSLNGGETTQIFAKMGQYYLFIGGILILGAFLDDPCSSNKVKGNACQQVDLTFFKWHTSVKLNSIIMRVNMVH
jgi:hypothetical protein